MKNAAKKPGAKTPSPESPSRLIDARIKELGDWRGETLARVRALIKEADPDVVEEVKWRKASNPMGVPVWSHDGMICTGETYKDYVKLTFAKGASLKDPARLFNASLEGNARRAIDIREDEEIDAEAFKALVRAAVALNMPKKAARPAPRADKADEESAVLATIAAMPGLDRTLGERLHAIVKTSAPGLSPRLWYGMPAYAKGGKVVCFFQSAQKFKTRYATLGFLHEANLDDGGMWPTAFALTALGAAEEARIGALVKKAVS